MTGAVPADRLRRLIAYVRVSTEGQADGYGIPSQAADISARARREGCVLGATFADIGVSGALEASERPGLSAALRALGDPGVDGLIVAKLDRLARALAIQEALLSTIWRDGHEVYTADAGRVLQDDPSDPFRTAARQMIGVFAELERAMILLRLRQGQIAKKALGLNGGGAYQFGWGRGGEDPREQRVLSYARHHRIQGASWRQIAEALNAKGAEFATRRGGRWTTSSAWSALRDREPPSVRYKRYAANPPPARTRQERARRKRRDPPEPMLRAAAACRILGVSTKIFERRLRCGGIPWITDEYGVRWFDPVEIGRIAQQEAGFAKNWIRVGRLADFFHAKDRTLRRWAHVGKIPVAVEWYGHYLVPVEPILNTPSDRIVLLRPPTPATLRSRRLAATLADRSRWTYAARIHAGQQISVLPSEPPWTGQTAWAGERRLRPSSGEPASQTAVVRQVMRHSEPRTGRVMTFTVLRTDRGVLVCAPNKRIRLDSFDLR